MFSILNPHKCYNLSVEMEKSNNSQDSSDLAKYREAWTCRDGRIVVLRPIGSQDKAIEKELINGLSLEKSRYRFFCPIKANEEVLNWACDIDYKNEIAIMAEYNSGEKKRNVGVVRLSVEPNLKTGEFAILVADDFQNCGLGTKLMNILIKIGLERELDSIYGIVLADNYKMLTLMKEFGFIVEERSYDEVKLRRQLKFRPVEEEKALEK